MKKKIGELKYRGRKKIVWAVPLEDTVHILLYFKEYDPFFVRDNHKLFEQCGWNVKYKRSWRFSDSYTIWYKGTIETCLKFLGKLNPYTEFEFKLTKPLDEVKAEGVLDLL